MCCYYYTLFFLLASSFLVSTDAKCDSNSFCFSPDSSANITISCLKNENVISLKWKTSQKTSAIQMKNGKNTLDFLCGYPKPSIGNERIDLKLFSMETLKSENVTSCQVTFYLNSWVSPEQPTLLKWNNEKSDAFQLDSLCNPKVDGLSKEFRRLLIKIHAILMLLGWLFFVPTGFLFARFGKALFAGKKLVGMPVWFQMHRSSTFLGVSCISISMLCILISQNFTWKGTGSSAWYWTQWHTDLGTISSVLAVSQPLNSLLRCPPSNSRRSIFNWAHRLVGIVSYGFAVAAIYIAAANYRKTWSEPLMEIVLTSIPTVLCLGTGILVPFSERRKREEYRELEMNEKSSSKKEEEARDGSLLTSWLFLVVGTCFGVATSLSLLVANGFKNA